jgi:hypothetical protein
MDTVGEFPTCVVWPEAVQDEARWGGESGVSRRRDEFSDSINSYPQAIPPNAGGRETQARTLDPVSGGRSR